MLLLRILFIAFVVICTTAYGEVYHDSSAPSHNGVENYHMIATVRDPDAYSVTGVTYGSPPFAESQVYCNTYVSYDNTRLTGTCETYTGDHQQVIHVQCLKGNDPHNLGQVDITFVNDRHAHFYATGNVWVGSRPTATMEIPIRSTTGVL